MKSLCPFFFLLAATALEVGGDAVVRIGLHNHVGPARIGRLLVIGMVLLLGYGVSSNLAPLEVGQVVGLYIATLFVMWQLLNFVIFKFVPTLPILIGGSLIVAGGLLVTFWTLPATQKP